MEDTSDWRVPVRVSWVLFASLMASGCMPENLGDGLDVVNQTNTKLFVIEQAIPANGGTTRLSFSDCNDSDLVAYTRNGSVVAELTERWCPGQTWTISAPGQTTLSEQ